MSSTWTYFTPVCHLKMSNLRDLGAKKPSQLVFIKKRRSLKTLGIRTRWSYVNRYELSTLQLWADGFLKDHYNLQITMYEVILL